MERGTNRHTYILIQFLAEDKQTNAVFFYGVSKDVHGKQ